MCDRFLSYLERERARLDAEIADRMADPRRDDLDVQRLKRARLVVDGQILSWRAELVNREPVPMSA